jgi:two-component system chemotaxis sensor kinase CheA
MRVRMVPIGDVFERMTFVARSLAREQGTRLALRLEGERTEVDKFVVERLSDPLLHIVRNAISHGLETPAERMAAGKPEEATLGLRAVTAGDAVRIDVEDDGRGIDAARVAERARAIGLPVPADLDAPALLDLLCAPGFSTRGTVDRASGRGVGMAVVRRVVGEMGGIIELQTRAGLGTSFSIHLPLTLAITDALIATVADRTFAIPQGAVREVMEVASDSIRRMEAGEVVPYRGSALPLVRLSQRFHLGGAPRASHHVFVAGTAQAPVGIAVDRIVGQREIVVRTFSDRLVKVDGIAGATELGDGRVVLILDPAALTRTLPRSRA